MPALEYLLPWAHFRASRWTNTHRGQMYFEIAGPVSPNWIYKGAYVTNLGS